MWSTLPEPVLLQIFDYLSTDEIFLAALTCSAWHAVLDSASLWKCVKFDYFCESDKKYHDQWYLKVVEKYGSFFSDVTVLIDQWDQVHRKNSILLLEQIALLPERQICKLRISFVGHNPLFYGGQEFYPVLQLLFSAPPQQVICKRTFTRLDFGNFPIILRDPILQGLTLNHTALKYLNIQNGEFICLITKDCLIAIVQSCLKLEDLRVYLVSVDDSVIRNIPPTLRHLSLFCLRQENVEISDIAWLHLKAKNPNVNVTLKFDHTVPLSKFRSTMNCNVPLKNLHIRSFTMVFEQVLIAVDNFGESLENIFIMSQPSEDLDRAVLLIASLCKRLKQLHVYASLDYSTIEDVLKLQPNLAANKKCCSLTNYFERTPAITDAILEEIQLKFK